MSFIAASTSSQKKSERCMIKKCTKCKSSLKHTSFKINKDKLNGIDGVGRSSICKSCSFKTKYPPRLSLSELQEKIATLYDIIEEMDNRILELENRINDY